MVPAPDNKIVVFPRYLALAKLTTDQFWKDFLYTCAINKKIRHLSLQANTITTYDPRYKKTITKLPDDDYEAFRIFQQLMKSELDLYSIKDTKNQQEIFNTAHKKHKLEFSEWKEISRQRTKDNLLLNYCMRFAEEHNLNQIQRSKHFHLIKYALAFKQITNKNIVVENSQIKDVTGIAFEENKKTFSLQNDIIVDKNTAWNEKTIHKIGEKMDTYYKQRFKTIKI